MTLQEVLDIIIRPDSRIVQIQPMTRHRRKVRPEIRLRQIGVQRRQDLRG